MSTILLMHACMHIIPSDKWLTTEYLRIYSVALLFLSDWHSRAFGCPFHEEYGEAMLSRLLMRSKEVGNAPSVQQTFDIFRTLPPTLPGQKNYASVLTVQKYTRNVRLFIQNVSHACFSVPVFQEDKYLGERLEEAVAMRLSGVLSRAQVKEQDFAKLLTHNLRCLIARTQIPNGVEDFLYTYAQKRYDVD